MKKLTLGLFSGLLLLTASCTSVKHTATTVPVETQIVSFTVADLDVAPQKVSKSVNWDYKLFCRPNLSELKQNAEAALLDEVGGDVLVEPEYIIERRGCMRGGTVTVVGYPAKFQNFHTPSPAEAAMMNGANAVQGKHVKVKKNKRFLVF